MIKKILKIILFTILDICLIVIVALSNYYFVYLMPHKEKNEENEYIQNTIQSQNVSKENTQNESSYKSSDISVTISKNIYISKGGTSILDKDSSKDPSQKANDDLSNRMLNPPMKKEDSKVQNDINKNTTNYYVADIYISDINSLKTHFAKSTYGTGYTDSLINMCNDNNSIIAINGDSYSYNKSKNCAGPLVRNGTIYRMEDTNSDVCVLYKNGIMETYTNDVFKSNKIDYDNVYQTWVFGPCLLDNEGKHINTFNTSSYIKGYHPRTAIGYFSPGHYCFVVVDGRGLNSSEGLHLDDLSKIFESLGCKTAYNLDGGHCSFMTYNNEYVNVPGNKSTEITDGIFIEEVK